MNRGVDGKKRWLCACVAVLVAVASVAAAGERSISERIAGWKDGTVRLTFAARDGVCGDGSGSISFDGSRFHSGCDDDWGWERECEEEPVRVAVRVRDGEIVRIKTRVGGSWRGAGDGVLDLGEVSPQDAADFLLDLAGEARGSVAEDAILPAILARDVVVWPRVLEIAREHSRDEDVRRSAVFWLGQLAGEKATQGLVELVEDDDEDLEVREAAVFALSQGRTRESLRYLMQIARTNRHPQIRKQALFWLAQRDDPEVLDLFEEILLGK
jgi:hypothetical protein